MSTNQKRWYDIAVLQLRTHMDALPKSDEELKEVLRKKQSSMIHSLLRIDAIMSLIKAAQHDIPMGERPRLKVQTDAIQTELKRFSARVTAAAHSVN